MSTRRVALEILTRIEREGAWASPLIESASLEDRDRRFVRTLVFAVLRWQSTLDWWIGSLASRPVSRIEPPVLRVLRLGLAQIAFTDVSDHAAVNETVSLCTGNLARSRGMVNAVLRRAARESLHESLPQGTTPREIASRWGHPEWLIARWARQYGVERAEAIAKANQELSRSDLLVNTRVVTPEVVREVIENAGGELLGSSWFDDVFRTTGSPDAHALAVSQGRVYPMDEGSIAAARSFSASVEGVRVLDVSAAPGGKTIVMDLDGANVVANDISFPRLGTLRESFTCFSRREPRMVCSDGTLPPFAPQSFSHVLLDAPCSATGIIRRNPEIRWRLREEDLASFAAVQKNLLRQAMTIAREEIVYSTCSLEWEENDEVVEDAVASVEGWGIDSIVPAAPGLSEWMDGRALRITPESGADGFTIHRLKRL